MSEIPVAPPPPPPYTQPQFSKLNSSLWILFTITGVIGIIQALLAFIRGSQYVDLDNGITANKIDAVQATNNLINAVIGLQSYIAIAIFVLLVIYCYKLVVKVKNAGFAVRLPNGLAIGAWFIPFANAILCFLFFLDVAKADSNNRQRGLLFLNLWWWLYLVGIHGSILFEISQDGSDYYTDAGFFSFVSAGMTLVAVASTFFAVLFFRQIRYFEATLNK
jgi:hypothetical protein